MKVFHGTTKHNWESKSPDKTILQLAANKDIANEQACETAADNEYNRLRPIPIIVSIDIEDLLEKDLEFDAEIGWSDSISWQDSIRQSSSFTIYGDIDELKSLFSIEKIPFKK